MLRPVLQGQSTLTQQSYATGIPDNRLWRDLQRFQRAGLVGLLDHRPLPHTRGKSPIAVRVPLHVQHQIVRLALAHPFTARELARISQTCYEIPIESSRGPAGPRAPPTVSRGVALALPDDPTGRSPAVSCWSAARSRLGTDDPRSALAPGHWARPSPPAVPDVPRISHGRAGPLAHH